MAALPPQRMDELREIAKALGGDRPVERPMGRLRAARWPRRTVVFGAVLVAAVLALARFKPEPCASARCGAPGADAPLRDTIAVALVPRDGEPQNVKIADQPAPLPSDVDDRLGTTEIGSLLAAERVSEATEGAASRAATKARRPKRAAQRPAPRHEQAKAARPEAAPITAAAARAERQPESSAPPTPAARGEVTERRVVPPPVTVASRPERRTVPARDEALDRRAAPPPSKPAERDAGKRDRSVAAKTPSLSGRWMLTNAIDKTDVPAFAGLRIRFRVRLEQHGDRIVGRGEKFTVNDKPVPASQRSPIELEGTVRGRDVIVHFVEHGSRRSSSGGIRWRISPDGDRLQGTFGSNAAGARGRSHASRER
ncbi:MAG: hypothetical protein ABIR79_12010 [Candidatus Binatia bacterium]